MNIILMHNRSKWSCWDCNCCDSDMDSLPHSIIQINRMDARNSIKRRTKTRSMIQNIFKERIITKKSEDQIIVHLLAN